jgi:thiol:disulfide interchange protein
MFVLSDVTAGEMQAEATAPHDTSPAAGEATDLDALAAQFRVGGIDVGYMAPDKFLAFLDNAEAGTVAAEKDRLVQRVFRRYGLLTVMLLLIPLGFLLNLTPCVLPMIPVNLAIIGAGAQSGSRTRGFALGGIYGLGMALVYGVLGLVVVLTGQQFGALNASPWFSLSITILFAVLALAMFDVFEIDLSRFQRRSAGSEGGGSKSLFATAFVLGGTAALLAGACVAPVLISTLVLAANLYQTNPAALLLPFMLGVGMALPWPFAGAGMSFLPKPGAWMDRVKKVFGVLILGVAIFYGILAVHQFRPAATDGDHKQTDVAAALQQGLDEGKPVLLDFWSLSCKACKAMDRNVFPNPTVHKRLEGYVFSGVQTDLTDRADVEWAVEHFDIKGLPTYVVLVPLKADGTD